MNQEHLEELANRLAIHARQCAREALLFGKALVLGVAVIILAGIPWLLRGLAVFSLMTGLWLNWLAIGLVFAPVSAAIPLLALRALPVVLFLGILTSLVARKKQQYLWGAMALLGGVSFLAYKGAQAVAVRQAAEALPIRLLPVGLHLALAVTITLRWRNIRQHRKEAQIQHMRSHPL